MKKLFTLFTALLFVYAINAANLYPAAATANSLRTAMSSAATGDIIWLETGTYTHDGWLEVDNKNIEIRAIAEASPVVKVATAIRIKNGAKLTIKGVEFDGSDQGNYYHFIRFYNNTAACLTLEDCDFHHCKTAIIRTGDEYKADMGYCEIINCTFHDNDKEVISLEGEKPHGYVRMTGCTFSGFAEPIVKSTITSTLDSCVIRSCNFTSGNTASHAVSINNATKYLGIIGGEFSGFTGNVVETSAALDSCVIKDCTFQSNSVSHAVNFGAAVGYINLSGSTFKDFTDNIVETSAALDSCVIKDCTFQNNATAHAINFGYATKYIAISGSSFKDFTGVIIAPTVAFDSIVIKNSIFDGGVSLIENNTNSKYLGINGCEFKNFTGKTINSTLTSHLDSCIIKNCYFHNSTGSAIFLTSNSTTNPCDKLHVINSTFANFSGFSDGLIEVRTNDDFHSDPNDDAEVLVDHCTFYSFIKNGDNTYGCVDIRKSSKGTVSNCIFENPTPLPTGQYNEHSTYMYGGYLYSTLSNNTLGHRSGPTTNATGTKTGDPLFANAASGNFHLGAGSPALGAASDGSDLGDPRWWTYGRGVTIGRFGTICLPYGVKAGTYSGATFYSIAGKRLDGSSQPYSLVLEIVSGDLKAGQPYFFEASAISLTAPYDGTPAEAGNYNGLFGTLVELNSDAMDALVGTAGKDIYLLSNNTVVKAGTGCSLTANRAYIDMEKVPEYVEPSTSAPGIREIPMAPQSGTSLQNVENAETIVKFIENGRILIRRDGVTYDALGRIVR